MQALAGLSAMASDVGAPGSKPGDAVSGLPSNSLPKISLPKTSLPKTAKDGLSEFGSTLMASVWPVLRQQPSSPSGGLAAADSAAPPKAEKKEPETLPFTAAIIEPTQEGPQRAAGCRPAPLPSEAPPSAAEVSVTSGPSPATLSFAGSAIPASSVRVSSDFVSMVRPLPVLDESLMASSEARRSRPAHEQGREPAAGSLAISREALPLSAATANPPLVVTASTPVLAQDRDSSGFSGANEHHSPTVAARSLQGGSSPPAGARSTDPSPSSADSTSSGMPHGTQDVSAVGADRSNGDRGDAAARGESPAGAAQYFERGGIAQTGPVNLPIVAAASWPGGGGRADEDAQLRAPQPGAGLARVSSLDGPGRSAPGSPGSGRPVTASGAASPQSAAIPGGAIGQLGGTSHPDGATRAEIEPAESTGIRAAGTSAGEVLARMDSGATSSGPPSHLPTRTLEVGIDHPAHGWIEVRAQGVSGQVSASLSAASPEASAALLAQLPGMAQYLAEREIGVQSLGMGGGSGPPGHSGEPRPGTGGFQGHAGADSFSGSNAGASQQDGSSSGRGSGGHPGLHPAPERARLPVPQAGGVKSADPGREVAASGAGAVHLISVRV
jgi:hypothetical protein